MIRSAIQAMSITRVASAAFVLVFQFVCIAPASAQIAFPAPSPTPVDPMPVVRPIAVPARPVPTAERIGVDTTNPLPLTLDQAIEMALRNNNDIEVSRNTAQISDFNVTAAEGVYDPVLNGQAFYESRTTPTASTIGGAVNGAVTQRQFFGDFGVAGLVPRYGGSYDLSFNSARSTTTNRNSTLNPQFPSNLIGTFTQPLFRGLRIDQNRRNILIARRNTEFTEAQLRQRAMDVVASVEQAYWNLTFALRNVQIQMDTLRQVREQLESNQRMVAAGVLAPIEVVASTAQITTIEQGIYAAQETVARAENLLKTLLLPDRNSPEWSRPVTPMTPPTTVVPQIGLEVALAEAAKNRPEIDQLQVTAEINEIDQRFFRDQTKPQIDLVGSYQASGLAGATNPLASGSANVPENLVGGLPASLANLALLRYPTYRAGVQFSLPLRNRTAKANLGRTLVEGTRIQNQLQQTEQVVVAEVRNSLQALRSAEARLSSASAARAAAEELFASEERQFRAGTATFYLVAQRQTELLAARGRELQAQTDLNRAISELQRAMGTTLTINNVTVTK